VRKTSAGITSLEEKSSSIHFGEAWWWVWLSG